MTLPAPDPVAAAKDPGGGGGGGSPSARGTEPAAHVPDDGRGGGTASAHVLAHLPPGAVRAAGRASSCCSWLPPLSCSSPGHRGSRTSRLPAVASGAVHPARETPPPDPPGAEIPSCTGRPLQAAPLPETINRGGPSVGGLSLVALRLPAGGRPAWKLAVGGTVYRACDPKV